MESVAKASEEPKELSKFDAIERLEAAMLTKETVDLPVKHTFADGTYMREMYAPAGTVVIGHEHKVETINIMLTGRAIVRAGDKLMELRAPCTFVGEPGSRKAAFVLEDMRWINVHPNEFGTPANEEEEEAVVGKLEDKFIKKSQTFLDHQKALEVGESLKEEIVSLLKGEDAA